MLGDDHDPIGDIASQNGLEMTPNEVQHDPSTRGWRETERDLDAARATSV